jgi:alkylation response protein AidB-like acyl-CoA dehydrogenase
MQFSDSETQKLLRDTTRSYLADKFPWDRLYALEQDRGRLTDADLKGFAELGWLGLLAPESAGGAGASLLEAAVVIEEFGYAAVPAPLGVSNIAADLLARADNEEAVRDHLAGLCAGDRLYTVGEANRRRGRSAPRGAAASPPLSASGGTISGVVPLVPFAESAEFVLAPLTVDGEPAFAAVSLAGARREEVELLDRSTYRNVHIEDASLDRSLVLGRGGRAEELHDRCDALVTALSLIELAGMMQRTLEMTSQYITNRVQFGRPIATFQAARHRAAELLMRTETTRWAAYHAIWRLQNDPADTDEIWLAKHWAIRAADLVYQNSHLLHGGVGVGMEYPLHLFTQQIAGFAVRGGAMNEMVARTVESLKLQVTH